MGPKEAIDVEPHVSGITLGVEDVGRAEELRWQGPRDGFAAWAESIADERLAERAVLATG